MTEVACRIVGRRERKKTAIRAQILSTAIKLFSQLGLENVTMDEIAAAADVGKGTIYNYFKAKEDIVVAFMVDTETQVQAKVSSLISSRGSLESILEKFIAFQFSLKAPYHPFVRIFLAQMLVRTAEFLPYMVEMQKAIDPPLEALFSGLQRRGLIRRDMPLQDLIVVFKTIQLGTSLLWAVEGPPFRQTEKVIKQEIKLFCEGLGEKTC